MAGPVAVRRDSTRERVARTRVGRGIPAALPARRAGGDAGIPSNRTGFDEDVNVYVVGLLGRFLSAEYHESAARYIFPTDLDLAREVAAQR